MKPSSLPKKNPRQKLLHRLFPNLMLHKKAEGLPLQINWRRIFILPTKPGLFFGFIASLMLVASLNFNNNMGLMMTFLLFGLAQVALHQVFFNIRNLTIDHVSAKPVFMGENATFVVHFKAEEAKYDLCVNHVDSPHRQGDRLVELPAEELKSLEYHRPTQQRGWMSLGKIRVFSSYPFGLFYAWIWTTIDSACLVYPMPEKSPPPLPTQSQSDGEANLVKKGEEFHGVKPFQSGDAKNLIAWKRTAQTGELISREFQQTVGHKLLLDYTLVNVSGVEAKLSRLTAWVILAHQQQLDYCLKLPKFNSGFAHSSKHHLKCLKALALFQAQ